MKIEILQQHGVAALVEWHDANGVHRATIPANAIAKSSGDNGGDAFAAEYEMLTQGIPYGEMWELWNLGNVGSERVAQELRARNVWTLDDARRNLAAVRAALAAAYSKDLELLLNAARAALR